MKNITPPIYRLEYWVPWRRHTVDGPHGQFDFFTEDAALEQKKVYVAAGYEAKVERLGYFNDHLAVWAVDEAPKGPR